MDQIHQTLGLLMLLIESKQEYIPEEDYKKMILKIDYIFGLIDEELNKKSTGDFVINNQIQ